MGLITSTGIFKYIPPNPQITSISSPTGDLGQLVSIYGSDLDYVDTLSFAGENLNFALTNGTQQMDFLVPSNPDTGVLRIGSNIFEITGKNNLPFLPIFVFDDFDPNNGSEGDTINVNGKVLTSVVSGYISAIPILNDIDYYFSGDKNTFTIPMSSKSGAAEISLVQDFNLNSEINDFKILNINNFDYTSGKSIIVSYDIPGNLSQKYYENHLLSMSGFICPDFQSFKITLQSGSSAYTINIPSGFSGTDYSVFYNLIQTGIDHDDSYISDKTTGSFKFNRSNILNYPADLNVLLIKSSGFVFDGGLFQRSYIDIPANYSTETVYFDRLSGVDRADNLYPPFLFTSIEKINNVNIGSTYAAINIYNLQKNYFSVAIPNATPSQTFRLNYLTISNGGTNLSTFVSDGNYSYYKKVYLLTGNADTFQEKISLQNLIINDKNNLSFQIPSTDYYMNGKIQLINSTGISKESQNNFTETPKPTAILPNSGYRGSNIMIQGKSFKRPVLIDSPYQYDSCFVRFRYADNIYPPNKSTFQASFRIMSKNLLSGYIPLSNIPTGRYAIQMMSEDGGLFE
jgi:hypothetical protein